MINLKKFTTSIFVLLDQTSFMLIGVTFILYGSKKRMTQLSKNIFECICIKALTLLCIAFRESLHQIWSTRKDCFDEVSRRDWWTILRKCLYYFMFSPLNIANLGTSSSFLAVIHCTLDRSVSVWPTLTNE